MSATSPAAPVPELGPPGDPCRSCGTPLNVDQRYCLSCGTRRGDPRVPFAQLLGPAAVEPPPTQVGRPVAGPAWLPAGPAGPALLVLGLLLALGVGALLGRSAHPKPQIIVSKPPVVNVTGGGGVATGSSGSVNAAFTSDWPASRDAWTIQLKTLPKGSSSVADVDAAKRAAKSKGAPKVGALDADRFRGLGSHSYIVFSGVFPTKKAAVKAVAALRKKFPGAKPIHVTGGGGASNTTSKNSAVQRSKQSGQQFEKKSLKLPNEIAPHGKPPPVDHKPVNNGQPTTKIG